MNGQRFNGRMNHRDPSSTWIVGVAAIGAVAWYKAVSNGTGRRMEWRCPDGFKSNKDRKYISDVVERCGAT